MIFETQTSTVTIVRHSPQEQMVGIRIYPSIELFFAFPRFNIMSLRDVLHSTFPYIISSKAKVFSDRGQAQ